MLSEKDIYRLCFLLFPSMRILYDIIKSLKDTSGASR